MSKTFFKNAFNYNEKKLTNYSFLLDCKANLSSLLYEDVSSRTIKSLLFKNHYDISKIIIPDKVIKSLNKNIGEKYCFAQPDVKKLATAFNIDLSLMTADSIFDFSQNTFDLMKKIEILNKTITDFCHERYSFFNGIDIPLSFKKINGGFINPEEEKEYKELIISLNLLFCRSSCQVTDYIKNHNTEKIELMTYEKSLSKMYNYKSMYNHFKNLITNNPEYLNSSDMIEATIELQKKNPDSFTKELKNLNDMLDFVNNSKLFNKDTLLMTCLYISSLIEKEEALDKFIRNVLNHTTSIVTISEDNNFSTSKKETFNLKNIN